MSNQHKEEIMARFRRDWLEEFGDYDPSFNEERFSDFLFKALDSYAEKVLVECLPESSSAIYRQQILDNFKKLKHENQ